jgi:hypothetical protein
MKVEKRLLFPLSVGAVFCIALLVLGAIKLTAYGQSALVSDVSEQTSIERPREFVKKTASVSAANFGGAAAKNAKLKNSLSWAFGSKAQRGWYIYEPLIQHTIGTEAAPETPEFASAVAEWQQKFDLSPTGTIDASTISKMVGFWQSRRIKTSQYPSDDQLFSAPVSDFYDPTRGADLLKVEREAYAAYKKMLAAAIKDLKLKTNANGELAPDEKFLRIVSSFRSREYQAKLRQQSPNAGRAALAVNSPHFTGRALDIYVGGEPTITKDPNRAIQVKTPAYKWLVKNAERFGFYPYYYEPWHWEYIPNAARENLNK